MNGNSEDGLEQHHSRGTIGSLIDRQLDAVQIKEIQSAEKDPDRFDHYLALLQERVPWPEPILLPIHDHLFIVAKGGIAITKSACGHEFGDWRINWKLHCRIRVRRTQDELLELYPEGTSLDVSVIDFREFVCPGCGTMLDVDTAPPHYPIEREFLPDIATFYEEWLGQRPEVDLGVWEDRSQEVVDSWAAEAGPLVTPSEP